MPPHLQDQVADPGIYSEIGFFGLGPGWYHVGNPTDQTLLGHPGEADYFVFDFGVTAAGQAQLQGDDLITHFELARDGIVLLNDFAPVEPGVSYNTVAQGLGPKGQLEDRIEYDLVHLRFDGSVAIQTEVGRIGLLGFGEVV